MSTKGGPSASDLSEELTVPHRKKKKTDLLRNVTQGLRIEPIRWNDLGNVKWI